VTSAAAGVARAPELRPAREEDRELLYRIYASTRTEELTLVPWDERTKEVFLRTQFAAQDAYYRQTYPHASYDVVVTGGELVGRLYVDRAGEVVQVIDIALLPAQRGRGIGTALLTRVIDEAEALGKPVRLSVELSNRARRLYERLGFRRLADDGVYLRFERPA
jgi:ribosomal protein S18 acetylase RimI-like enzyme